MTYATFTHSNFKTAVSINWDKVVAIYFSERDSATHIVCETGVFPVKESVEEVQAKFAGIPFIKPNLKTKKGKTK